MQFFSPSFYSGPNQDVLVPHPLDLHFLAFQVPPAALLTSNGDGREHTSPNPTKGPNSTVKNIAGQRVRTLKMQKDLTCNSFVEASLIFQVLVLLKSLRSLAHDLAIFILGVVPFQCALQEVNGQLVLLLVVVPYSGTVVLLQSRQEEDKTMSGLHCSDNSILPLPTAGASHKNVKAGRDRTTSPGTYQT